MQDNEMKPPGNRLSMIILMKERKQLSFFNKIILWLNYFVFIGLLLAYIAPYINPQNFWFLAFFGMAYPIFVLFNLFFSLYWLIRLKWLFIWSLLLVAFGFNTLGRYIQWSGAKTEKENGIKVMSFNCMLFDLYNWKNNSLSRDSIYSMLKLENPSILCLQEYYTSEEKGDFNNNDSLVKLLQPITIYTAYTSTLRNYDHWGLAILSKYPILQYGKIDFETPWNNACLFTDVLIDRDTFRIYNVHLASVHFGKKDYSVIDSLNNEIISSAEVEGSKNILRLLKRGFIARASQVMRVRAHMDKCPYPIILCGDFNDTPNSFSYKTMKGNLEDSFTECGYGIGKTYNKKIPALRIDYIMHDESLEAYNYYTVSQTITDHYPIVSLLKKK